MLHQDFLRFAGGRYLWWSLALVLASTVLYFSQGVTQPPNGGTWQGYLLGTVAALLLVWLALLGVRKRSYRSRMGSVQGWLSAHVYLGGALLIVATFHSAGQLNWNVHTLAYVLMVIVILSGFFGAYAYLGLPGRIARNRAGATREALFGELFELDQQGGQIAELCDPDMHTAVKSAIERTVIGGSSWEQLRGSDRSRMIAPGSSGQLVSNRDQQPIVDLIGTRVPRAEKSSEAANLHALLTLMCRRQEILRRIREDIRRQGWLKVWLYLHVPVTVALIGALVIHVLTTYLYW